MRKQRTRSHIIADLSVNHFERQALLCGYTVERMVHDYGIDLLLLTYDDNGWVENDSIRIQMKATDRLLTLKDKQTITFRIDNADLQLWLEDWLPVILVIYDAQNDRAYWLHIQDYFAQQDLKARVMGALSGTHTIHLPMSQVVDTEAIRQFARLKATIRKNVGGNI